MITTTLHTHRSQSSRACMLSLTLPQACSSHLVARLVAAPGAHVKVKLLQLAPEGNQRRVRAQRRHHHLHTPSALRLMMGAQDDCASHHIPKQTLMQSQNAVLASSE